MVFHSISLRIIFFINSKSRLAIVATTLRKVFVRVLCFSASFKTGAGIVKGFILVVEAQIYLLTCSANHSKSTLKPLLALINLLKVIPALKMFGVSDATTTSLSSTTALIVLICGSFESEEKVCFVVRYDCFRADYYN